MTVIPFIHAFTHKNPKIKESRKRTIGLHSKTENKNRSWMLADKDFYLWFNSCLFDLAMTVTTIGPLNWFRILSIDWIFLIHLNKKEQKISESFECWCSFVCAWAPFALFRTNIAISSGCLPLLQWCINTRQKPYGNGIAKCLSFRAKRMQAEAHTPNVRSCNLFLAIAFY